MIFKRILLVTCFSFLTLQAIAATNTNAEILNKIKNEHIPHGIKYLLQRYDHKKIAKSNVGVVIQSLKTGKIIYQYRANHLFMPASTQKLLTAVTALDYLKPSYQFHTLILSQGQIKDHVLHGNLYFKFTGDPEFTRKELNAMDAKLRSLGIQKIKGHVYIDNFAYNNLPYPPGWIWDDMSFSFAAPMNAIIINRNKFLLQMKPSKTLGARPALSTKLPRGTASFSNQIKTTRQYVKDCPITVYSDASNHYRVGGCLMQKYGAQRRDLAIRNVVRYTELLIPQLLKQNKIAYTGKVRLKKAPRGTKTLVDHASPVLAKVIKEMLKESDNLTTNSVLRKIGQRYFKTQSTWQNSLRALKKLLAPLTGINFMHNLINDGAGLSRYNLITPTQLLKVLDFAYHKKSVQVPLLKALPIMGEDGTLKYRLTHFLLSKRIHAKTGSMTGVSALAGYVYTKNNGPLAFVIIANDFVGPTRPYTRFENKLCRYLVDAKRSVHG